MKTAVVHCALWHSLIIDGCKIISSFSAVNRSWQVMSQGYAAEELCCEPQWVKKDQTSCIHQTSQI